MLTHFLNLIFGSKNEREIKALRPTVDRINALEPSLTPLSDHALSDKTQEFRKRRLRRNRTVRFPQRKR